MPSAVIHGVVPLLFLLALRHVDARKIWILWPVTFLPDLDYFLGLHRAALTNVFVLAPVIAIGIVAWRRDQRQLAEWMLVASVYLASHFVMDLMWGGITPLWPLSDYTICYYAEVVVHTPTNAITSSAGPCSHEGRGQVIVDYTWLDMTDSAILAFVVPAGLLVAGWHLRRYVAERRASA